MPQLQADWVCDPSGNILVNRLYSTATLSDAAEELAARSGDRIDLQVEHSSPNRAIDPRHSFDGVPDWVMVLFHDTYAADFTLSGHAMGPDRVRQSVSPGGGGWEALAQELAPRIAKQAARLHHLERQLAAIPQITVK
ncbi:MAG: hypothetical protein HWD84_08385 [Flavobacteriaceae bacterium]|nr:hypothetical protein [Flavobacteriaceae bacterium]